MRPILLVEDCPRDLELTLEALTRSGCARPVDVARDGVEALDYLERSRTASGCAARGPAVVLLDLRLPKIDGLEVLARVRKDERLKRMPIVVWTASASPADVASAYALGANAFVAKPAGFGDFRQAVQRVASFWGRLNEPPA